ncbi:MAG TPA: hypothetical protein PKE07_09680 [Lacibacter sp.]|nr:hypothetical protein [Lacibacter sp.]
MPATLTKSKIAFPATVIPEFAVNKVADVENVQLTLPPLRIFRLVMLMPLPEVVFRFITPSTVTLPMGSVPLLPTLITPLPPLCVKVPFASISIFDEAEVPCISLVLPLIKVPLIIFNKVPNRKFPSVVTLDPIVLFTSIFTKVMLAVRPVVA